MHFSDDSAEKLQQIISSCRSIEFDSADELLFTDDAPAGLQIHGIPRLSFLFQGDMTFDLYKNGTHRSCRLAAPAIYYCTETGYLYSFSRDQLFKAVSFCYYPQYIRVSAVDMFAGDREKIFAVHTMMPLSHGGTLLIEAFETLQRQGDFAIARKVIANLWEATLNELSEAVHSSGTRQPKIWNEMTHYLLNSKNFTAGREDAAAFLGVSPGYISKLCRRHTGETFVELQERYKMQHGAMLLRFSSLSIKDISSRCGFSYRPYFDRRFKKHYGITPAEYRKKENGCVSPGEPQPDK